ncbi:MAG TPA: Na+/H+ antiporter NhaC family protein [Longimicrobiales bacterium]|nr:Na+/H+ antiporter NhaC family protein [Longimicrobiales bacterium]
MDAVAVSPGWLSLLPPLAAIIMALVFREVVISLFAGVWLGAFFLASYDPLEATLRSVDTYAVNALTDADHVAIIVFSLLLGGMVGVISRNGGTQGMVESMRGAATSRRRGQFFTWLAGIAIFFDDYANTLIVGNTMRPVTDRLKVSREKLAYIVDSTAAPMAAIALISTWVGFEITLIGDTLRTAAGQVTDPAQAAELLAGAENPFNVFLHSIPYLFYPILALLFVAMVVWTRRDFGPMHAAEERAASGRGLYREGAMLAADTSGGLMEAPEGKPRRWYNAAVPVLATVAVALGGIYFTGAAGAGPGAGLREIVGEADPFKSLIWASFIGSVTAIVMSLGQRILSVTEAVDSWVGGMRAMMLAMIILVLAWSLGGVTEDMGTGPYLSSLLQDTLPIHLLPVLVFLTAAVISFATGTSWGTMSILFPVVVPLAVAMGAGVGFDSGGHYTILLGVVSSIMAGSIFGDHCSPISDTTVLSSMASGCDHVDHVRTQLPYAMAVGAVAMLVGDIPTAYGLNPFVSLVLGLVILYGLLRFLGRPVTTEESGQRTGAGAQPGSPYPVSST